MFNILMAVILMLGLAGTSRTVPTTFEPMDDIIAIEIKDEKKGKAAFLTWGRVFERVDVSIIQRKIADVAPNFGFYDVRSVSVCDSLRDVAHYPYFYESLIHISWKPIPSEGSNHIFARFACAAMVLRQDGHAP
jgi:hypothetical protein